MSAIVGIHYLNQQPVDRSVVEQMVMTLAHRGSDGVGLWVEGAIGLGHRLLWTTAEALHEQFPLENADGTIVLTADARIDNRDQLIAALDLTAPVITDSQLILAAYERWGDRCTEHLLGDFAIAIWDQPKQQLFCARDHFGVKPFYYYQSEQVFVFATEIKALFCSSEVPQRINDSKLLEHLDAAEGRLDDTFYQDIFRLPPAHQMIVNSTGISLRNYWSLDRTRELNLSAEAAAVQFLEIFTEAVRCRLRSAFPVGAMLSGGLDSSSITCVARNILAEARIPLHTFSSRFDAVPQSDERQYQEAVLQQGGLQPHYLDADRRGPLSEIDRVMWHQEEPLLPGNLYMLWGLYDEAQKQNVRVILDGFDGDTTVSHGTEYLRELAQRGEWLKLWNETKAFGNRFNLPWKKVFLNWFWRYGIKFKMARLKWRKAPKTHEWNPPKTERENHYRLLTRSVMPHILELKNQSAGAFSLEIRVPFFDKRLVEFCLALPPEHKLHQGWGRIVLRRAMQGILPEIIQWRVDKTNLHHSFEYGLRQFELKQFETVLDHSALLQPYLDLATLRPMHDRFVAQTATEAEVNRLWRAVTLALWLRRTASLSTVKQEVMPGKQL
jgi:asparagine synthase (glutamine-hydrolysing)